MLEACIEKKMRCILSITVEDVYKAAEKLLLGQLKKVK